MVLSDGRFERTEMSAEEVTKEIAESQTGIDLSEWKAMFEKCARLETEGPKRAFRFVFDTDEDARRFVSLGYYHRKKNFPQYLKQVELDKRGNIVWIRPSAI